MAMIVGIGANVFDTLYSVDSYPKEDTKLKANAVKVSGGGPCATGLVAASKLGAKCAFIGNLSDDNGGKYLKSDFENTVLIQALLKLNQGMTHFHLVYGLQKNQHQEHVFSLKEMCHRQNLISMQSKQFQKHKFLW